MDRLSRIQHHISPAATGALPASSPDDVCIVSALRTPICRARKGGLATVPPHELLAVAMDGVMAQSGVGKGQVGDIVVGNVLMPGGGALSARQAMFLGGFPAEVPISTVNRQCSSGLQAVANVASAISANIYDVGIAAGVESMSFHDMMGSAAEYNASDSVMANGDAQKCLIPMGITSENVAELYGLDRAALDQFAVSSHQKAARAQAQGLFDAEIVTVTVKEEDGTSAVVSKDDGPRAGSTLEKLMKLKPAFKPDGSTTAGNASQVSDGAAAVLLMKRSKAQELGCAVLGTIRSYACVGVAPEVMGIGPAEAIPVALEKAGLGVADVDIFEINEAFASQATYCVDKLKIPHAKVNPKGGAIAFGHPLGCTGARQVATLLHELRRTGGQYGVVSMCIGTGMGAAAVFQAE